jgi:hypothetical protein
MVAPNFNCVPVDIVACLAHGGVIILAFDYMWRSHYSVISVELKKAVSGHDNEGPCGPPTSPKVASVLINIC